MMNTRPNGNEQQPEKVTKNNIVPFIELDQYLDFVEMCDFIQKYCYLGLLLGPAGAGKTVSARRYRDEQPLMTANGRSPVLYFQLARGEESHRALYRRVIEAITGSPYRNRLSAADLISEIKRLFRRYGYSLIIIDEVGFLNNDGLEGARTLHDELEIPIAFIAMDTDFTNQVETALKQFNSRIADVREFGLLSYDTLKFEVLPQISPASHLTFSPEQSDADEIVMELFEGAGGMRGESEDKDKGARFRDVQVLLVRCHDLLDTQLRAREEWIAENPRKRNPKLPVFNAELIGQALKKSKMRGKQPRPPKTSGKSPSLVRDDRSQPPSPEAAPKEVTPPEGAALGELTDGAETPA